MPAQTGILSNPMLALLPPDQQQSLLQLQQRQAIGQSLLQQGLTPLDTANRQAGGMAYHVSPLEGVSKMLNAYLGNKISMDSMGQQGQIMGGMYANAFGGSPQAAAAPQGAPATGATPNPFDAGGMTDGQSGAGVQSTPVPTPGVQPSPQQVGAAMGGGQPQAPQQSPGGALTLPGKTPQQSMQIFSIVGPEAYGKMLSEWSGPTAATKAAQQGGFDPAAANRAMFSKDSYIAPVQVGANTMVMDPRTGASSTTPAAAPAGAQNIQGVDGKWYTVPVAGGTQANQAASAADAAGRAQYQLTQVYNPTTQQMEFKPQADVANATSSAGPAPIRNNNPGAMMPGGKLATYPDMQTGLQALDNNLQSYGKQGVNTISGVIGKWAPPNENDTQAYIKDVSQRLGIGPNQKLDLTNPLQRQALSTAISLHENGPAGVFGSGGVAAAPPMGTVTAADKGAGNLQDELSKKWTDLSSQNQQAQTTTSYLQNIKSLAGQAATGQQSDKLNYVNGLLSLAGSEKATDAVTANNLLDKYSNQITARLSSNGMGTDSARQILQSAYPNAHMTPQAINEAADNLMGANTMVQAKARLLTPLANARNATEYNNTELKFDQNADPRIFQYANIQDPAARQAFAKQLVKQDPKIVNKIQALQGMGAF